MKEHPIIFSAPMIRALLADRKHVTRRLSKQWLKVRAGDRLWVRETLRRPYGDPWVYDADRQAVMVSQEDETAMVWVFRKEQDYCTSMFMPRWASRILLECEEDARLERLRDITEKEAISEGIEAFDFPVPPDPPGQFQRMYGTVTYFPQTETTAIGAFARLWRTIHSKPGERWEENPEVVRVGRFRRIA